MSETATEPFSRADPAVLRWFASAGHDEASAAFQDRYLGVLEGFCRQVELNPSQLVEFCFLRKRATGERFVSSKRRLTVNEWIDQYVAAQQWTGKDAVTNANIVRGFLIHNAVLIQGAIWTGR